eukprot:467302_1
MPQQIEKKKDTTNRYDLVGVSNTWMTLPMKNNKRQLKIKGRGRTAKTISIDCPKELNEDVTDDVDELWSTFKEQYDENLNEEIDKILKYANAKDRKQAFDEKWKSKKAHWEKQDTEQRKLNKDYYRTKWKRPPRKTEVKESDQPPPNAKVTRSDGDIIVHFDKKQQIGMGYDAVGHVKFIGTKKFTHLAANAMSAFKVGVVHSWNTRCVSHVA